MTKTIQNIIISENGEVKLSQEYLEKADPFISQIEPGRVRVLGPKFTFSENLARILFDNPDADGHRADVILHDSFTDVYAALQHDTGSVGILPIENSGTSAVQEVTDPMLTGDYVFRGEAWFKIVLALAGNSRKTVPIKKVYSQAKPFGQARKLMQGGKRPLEAVVTESTSLAASIVREDGTDSVATLCSARAVSAYNLTTIKKEAQDDPNNMTRFLVIQSKVGAYQPDLKTLEEIKSSRQVAKVAGLVKPVKRGTAGQIEVLNFMDRADVEVEEIAHRNILDEDPTLPGTNRSYVMEFVGNPRNLQELLKDPRNYRERMQFKLLGVYPVGSAYRDTFDIQGYRDPMTDD